MGKNKDKNPESKAGKKRRREDASNLSSEAQLARGQGERAWTRWALKDIAEEAQRLNPKITLDLLSEVRSRGYVKVKLLKRGKEHEEFPQQDEAIRHNRVPFFRINAKKVRKLEPKDVRKWAKHRPGDEELDEAIANLRG